MDTTKNTELVHGVRASEFSTQSYPSMERQNEIQPMELIPLFSYHSYIKYGREKSQKAKQEDVPASSPETDAGEQRLSCLSKRRRDEDSAQEMEKDEEEAIRCETRPAKRTKFTMMFDQWLAGERRDAARAGRQSSTAHSTPEVTLISAEREEHKKKSPYYHGGYYYRDDMKRKPRADGLPNLSIRLPDTSDDSSDDSSDDTSNSSFDDPECSSDSSSDNSSDSPDSPESSIYSSSPGFPASSEDLEEERALPNSPASSATLVESEEEHTLPGSPASSFTLVDFEEEHTDNY